MQIEKTPIFPGLGASVFTKYENGHNLVSNIAFAYRVVSKVRQLLLLSGMEGWKILL